MYVRVVQCMYENSKDIGEVCGRSGRELTLTLTNMEVGLHQE